MAMPPERAAAAEAQGERRVAALVGALLQRRVFSRAQLAAVWAQDRTFLLIELAAWLQKVGVCHTFKVTLPCIFRSSLKNVSSSSISSRVKKTSKSVHHIAPDTQLCCPVLQ
jgi:hypothetical protein